MYILRKSLDDITVLDKDTIKGGCREILWEGELPEGITPEMSFGLVVTDGTLVYDAEYEVGNKAKYDALCTPVIVIKPKAVQVTELFLTLPVEARAAFVSVGVAVKQALEIGDTELAAYLVANLTVPVELEPVKTVLLGVING